MKLERIAQRAALRVSQEDASPETQVEIKDQVELQAEPEELPLEDTDCLIEADSGDETIRSEIKEMADIQESLEHYQNVLQGSLVRGGMRPEEGALFTIGIQHFNKRLGVEKQTLGMEDFGGNMSRLAATQISQEDLKDTASAVAARLKELLAKLVAFVKEQAAKWRGNSEMTTKVVEEAKEVLQQAQKSGNEPIQLDLTKVTALTKADLDEGFKTVISAANDLTQALIDIRKVLKNYGMSVKTLGSGEQSDLAIAEFARDFVEQWVPLKPMVAFAGGKQGTERKLSHAATVTYVVGGDLEVTTSEEARKGFSIEMTPSDFNILNGKVYVLNQAIQKLNDAYAETAAMVTKVVSADRKLTNRKAQEELAQADFDVVTTVKTDVYYIVANLVRARDQAGYIMGQAAKLAK